MPHATLLLPYASPPLRRLPFLDGTAALIGSLLSITSFAGSRLRIVCVLGVHSLRCNTWAGHRSLC